MKWTKKKPRKPGWYWHKCKDNGWALPHDAVVYHVRRSGHGLMANGEMLSNMGACLWSDAPIEEPQS